MAALKGREGLATSDDVQGCFWSEFTAEDSRAEGMIAPRILEIATKV